MSRDFGVLKNLVVLDLTQMLAGPYCTMILADHGADVIKIEPKNGDMSRSLGPFETGMNGQQHSGYFHSINRNKRSISLDLKNHHDIQIFEKMVKTADVVVENFREGVMERLGLSYEHLRTINPKLTYAAIRGFGDERTGEGPMSDWPAFDIVAQAMGGFMSMTGSESLPTKAGPGIGDIIPGIMCAFGIVAAVRHSEKTGEGQFLDVGMYDSVIALCERMIYRYSFSDQISRGEGNEHPLVCPFSIYEASDGWFAIACPLQSQWETLMGKLDNPDLYDEVLFKTNESRVENAELLREKLSDWTSQHSKKELSELLGGVVPCGPVNNVADIVQDPQVAARQMIQEVEIPGIGKRKIAGVPVKFSVTPGAVISRGPEIGEHTDEILKQFGLCRIEQKK